MFNPNTATALLGGWQVQPSITEEHRQVFQKALQGLTGADYQPLAVATQVVNGQNYCFICSYKLMVKPPQPEGFAAVFIYAQAGPPEPPVITKIERIV